MRIKKILETGEWSSDVDLQYVKNHPEDTCEECEWIKRLKEHIDYIINEVEAEGVKISLRDIRGFDKYQGPYAQVSIEGRTFKFWTSENNELYIENFIVDNQSEDGNNAGFVGNMYDIANTIIMAFKNKQEIVEKYEEYGRYN